ncbi:MAG: ribbon-helix-helix protein, CopG family [Blastocatellia bacterium]
MAEGKRKSKAGAKPVRFDKPVTFKISSELHEKVMEKSARTGISVSFVVRRALEKWVSNGDS